MIISLQKYRKRKLQEARDKVEEFYKERRIVSCLDVIGIQASSTYNDLENQMVTGDYYEHID